MPRGLITLRRGVAYIPHGNPGRAPGTFAAGINYPWIAYASDFGTGGFGDLTNFPQVASDFAMFRSQGVRVVRWWLMGDGRSCPVFNTDGTIAGLSTRFLADIDTALSICATNNIYILFSIMDQFMFSEPTFSGTVQQGGHENIIKDPTTKTSFLENALKPLLQHVAASPNRKYVYAWEICNEPEGQIAGGYNGWDFFRGSAQFALADIQAWVALFATYVHTYGGGTPVTLGSAIPVWCPLWIGLGLDFYQAHYYDFMDDNAGLYPLIDGIGLTPVPNITKDDGVTHLDKPCILGEFATGTNQRTGFSSYGLSDTTALSARWYMDNIFSRGYAGNFGWSLNSDTAPGGSGDWTSFQPVFTNWVTNIRPDIVGP